MNELLIKYGREKAACSLPPGLDIAEIKGRYMPPLDDPKHELRKTLNNPVGAPTYKRAIEGAQDVMITVADHTRYYGYDIWLSTLINLANQAGVDDDRISLYVASGTHRPMTDAEKKERFGEQVFRRVKILDHDCDAEDRLEKVGRTDFGTTVYVDSRVYKSDFLVITGGINYHYFAGYSGGRKSILPGICGRSTIMENHLRALNRETGDFADLVLPGSLIGNPVSEDMHEAAMLVRPNYCVNAVLNTDREICHFEAGDYGYVHRIGADWLDEYYRVEITRPADVAIIGAGGYPKDLNLFQAHKSLRHAQDALAPGAKVIWLACCNEGEGPAGMSDWRKLTLEDCTAKCQTHPTLVGFCSLSMKQIARQFDVHLVTELPGDVVTGWGLTPHRSLYDALDAVLAGVDADARWLVGADMSNLLPQQASADQNAETTTSEAGND